jgi:GAF domain-containing protein
VLERVAGHGSTEELPLETAGPSRDDVISEVVAAPEVREHLALLGPDSLLVLPLSTAGTVLGTMTVARRPGYAVDDSARTFLQDVADQVAAMLHVSLVVAEARRDGELYGDDRLRDHLLRGGSPAAVVEALEVSVDEFLGSPPRDDLAVLALRVRERP